MIIATHIVGLTSWERGMLASPTRPQAEKDSVCATLAARFHTIQASGQLLARAMQPGRGERRDWMRDSGRSFDFDELAGDGRYIFLETVSRYFNVDRYPAAAIYGWQFDAEWLVGLGALVCDADLGGEYDDVIYRACAEVAATLPRLPRVSDAELAEFARQMDEIDTELLAFVAAESEDPTDALHDTVRGGKPHDSVPREAVERAHILIGERIGALQQARRRGGAAAIELLRSSQYCELVVPERLSLDLAVAAIEAGRVVPR